MLTVYIQAAMRHAQYEIIEDPKPFYGSIPECQSVWATGETLEACREELGQKTEDRRQKTEDRRQNGADGGVRRSPGGPPHSPAG